MKKINKWIILIIVVGIVIVSLVIYFKFFPVSLEKPTEITSEEIPMEKLGNRIRYAILEALGKF